MAEPTRETLYINGRFLAQPVTGVQRYCLELLRAWDEMIDCGEIDPARYPIVCLVPRSYLDDPGWKHIEVRRVGRLDGNLWEQIDLAWYARGGLLFSPANSGPLLLPGQIVTLHDASVYAVPESYSLLFRLKYRVAFWVLGKTARRIITPSEFSKKELARWAGIDPGNMTVIPEAADHILRVSPDPSIFDRFSIGSRPYILTVGSRSRHKNLAVVLDAVRRMDRADFDLVIVGGLYSTVFQYDALDMPPNAIPVGYITDGELRALYERAAAFVYPSLYEGFGLPPLEAMTCGCPVICARAGSIEEVCGDRAVYFDPRDAGELAERMGEVCAGSIQTLSYTFAKWMLVGNSIWKAIF